MILFLLCFFYSVTSYAEEALVPKIGDKVISDEFKRVEPETSTPPGSSPSIIKAPPPGVFAQQPQQVSFSGVGVDDEDFDRIAEEQFGLTPAQIRDFRRRLNERAAAIQELPVKFPKPVSGSMTVSLAPGSPTPIIRVFVNHSTSFVVVDSTGQVWPVENYRVGDNRIFSVERMDASPQSGIQNAGSSFVIDTKSMYGKSNLILKLVGVAKPININLIAGQKEMDESIEIRVLGRGPNASVLSENLPKGVSAELLNILDGVPPPSARALSLSGVDSSEAKAWMIPSGKMIVRLPYKILSPQSTQFVSSSSGMNVYEIVPTTNILAKNEDGIFTISVQGW